MEQRLLQQPADVAAADPIDHPAAVPHAFDQAGEPQLRQVLAGDGGAAPGCGALTARSNSWVATLSRRRGSRARFLPFRVCAPVSNQNVPSAQSAPMPVTCGLPSPLIVVSHQV
jgi:hypothetical protein